MWNDDIMWSSVSADLSGFKVVYGDKVMKALHLNSIAFKNNTDFDALRIKPNFIDILVINEDGNIEVIRDEAWMFQFIPILNG